MKTIKKHFLPAIAFLLIFCSLLTVMTLFFLPKWKSTSERNLAAGLYREPENTIDALFLGSCNMYTAFSPTILYEEYGITSYNMACPDQELSTSYYYLKDALKSQKNIKTVVLESLFITHYSTEKRERYNRFALDYMPMSLNKIKLAWYTSKTESEIMNEYDSTASDRLLSFASYMFPLLRYHSRTDLYTEDITFFRDNSLYNMTKGAYPFFSFTTNDGNQFDRLFNGSRVNETAEKFFPLIKELCDENGIQLVVMKHPNYARWGHDDKQTKIARDYVTSFGVPYIDLLADEYNCFTENDYYDGTGNVNIYGMKKISRVMGDYFVNELGMNPSEISESDREKWDECAEWFNNYCQEKGARVSDGEIKRLSNEADAIHVSWNPCRDADRYAVYRADGHSEAFVKIAEVSGESYNDTNVEHGHGYSYYVEPLEGALKGQKSAPDYYVFVNMVQNLKAANKNGKFELNWDKTDGIDYYRVYRRYSGDIAFHRWSKTTKTTYLNEDDIAEGKMYRFRVTAVIEEDGVEYASESSIVPVLSQSRPVIKEGFTNKGKITIKWEKMKNRDTIIIYRRSEEQKEFKKYATLKGSATEFTDTDVTPGLQYFYKIASRTTNRGFTDQSLNSNTMGVVARE